MNLQDVQAGDSVTRTLGGAVTMDLRVTKVDEQFVYCGDWRFERETGVEYDPELGWGTQWGHTGSIITKVNKET